MQRNKAYPAPQAQDVYTSVIASPLGKIGIVLQDQQLAGLRLLPEKTALLAPKDSLSRQVAKQLTHYFADPLFTFTLNLAATGTPFQQKVWRHLQTVPSGQVLTYGDLAKQLRSSPRAIGQACRTNPILIIVPCHRVVGAGHIGGFGGGKKTQWLDVKRWLLQHEQVIV